MVKIRVPEFEIELPDSWGSDAEDVAAHLPQHYREFFHFLEEHAPNAGHVIVLGKQGFSDSIDVVFKP